MICHIDNQTVEISAEKTTITLIYPAPHKPHTAHYPFNLYHWPEHRKEYLHSNFAEYWWLECLYTKIFLRSNKQLTFKF